MIDRRAVPRHRTFLKGVLAFNNGNSSEDALVRNLGDNGALIELPHPNAPEALNSHSRAELPPACARGVASGGRIGLRFTSRECSP